MDAEKIKKVTKIALLSTNIAVLVLLLFSTMAGFFRPTKFLLFSFLGYGYLYLVIVNVIFIIVWLCMSSKWFLMSLIGILVRFTFLPMYFQVGGTESLSDEEIARIGAVKVLTYNVHHFQGIEMNKNLSDGNMMRFLEMVDEEKPDILTMQEYVGRGDTVHLTEQLTRRGYIYQMSGYESGSMTGEVIFSKLPIVDSARIKKSTIFYADMLHNDDTIRVFCLHLSSYQLDASDHQHIHDISRGNVDSATGRSTYRKFSETIKLHEEELGVLMPYISSGHRHMVFAGDFNDPPSSYFYQKCRKHLKDSYCEAGQGFSTTYHGTFTKSSKTIFPAFRIDMVLHTPDIKARSYKRLKSDISDHYPVLVALEIK